jgi:hypothetical protein
LDVDKKKEIKKQDDTSSYDDRLDVVQSSSKSSFFAFKGVLKSLGPGIITGAANEVEHMLYRHDMISWLRIGLG